MKLKNATKIGLRLKKTKSYNGNNNIFITGFMGSGKSTVGKCLAKKLNRKYIDLDEAIENFLDKNISHVINEFGIDYFRKIENQQLALLCKQQNAVISLGGGSLILEKNQKQIHKSGSLVFLVANKKTLLARLKKSYIRPLLKTKNYYELFEERKSGYMSADLSIRTDDTSPEEVANLIAKRIEKI